MAQKSNVEGNKNIDILECIQLYLAKLNICIYKQHDKHKAKIFNGHMKDNGKGI